ncbi:hypothetical protein BASA81_000473 [Batrachochytrium salamandrivorans]|nr:hypothetical protein BASA81_000473 [Batrachochytrium salamandrivorans]
MNQRLQTRLKTIRYGGLAWCLAFALVWFPPHSTTSWPALLHFTLSICLYDGFLTLVELSHTALLSEMTTHSQERAKFNSYSAVLAGLGSFSSFFGQYSYSKQDLTQFRAIMLLISLGCALAFVLSTHVLSKRTSTASSPLDPKKPQRGNPVGAFLFALRKHYNFWIFCLVSALQTFDCAFEKTSFVFMLDAMAPHTGTELRGLVVSLSFFLPWLATFLLTKQIQRRGVGQCISAVLFTRLTVCVVLSQQPNWMLLLLNRVLSELVCRLTPLVLADLVDEDRFLNQREASETKAASVIGTLQFFTKITSSLGPMLTFSLMTTQTPPLYSSWMMAVPLACVSAQMWLWQRNLYLYRDHDYYAKVKHYVEGV